MGSKEWSQKKFVKAAKPHKCSYCKNTIEPTQMYLYSKGIKEGQFYYGAICLSCFVVKQRNDSKIKSLSDLLDLGYDFYCKECNKITIHCSQDPIRSGCSTAYLKAAALLISSSAQAICDKECRGEGDCIKCDHFDIASLAFEKGILFRDREEYENYRKTRKI